jgi:hypothetical protein
LRHHGRAEAVVLGVLVHDPGHFLRARAHVGRGDVAVGPDDVVQFVDKLAGDPLEFAPAERERIDGDASFGAAVGQIDHGRFPGHQRCQRAHFVEIDLRMKPQPPLHRPPRIVVLHAVADERSQLAVVHLDRDLDLHLALGHQQQAAHIVAEVHVIGGPIEIHLRGVESAHAGKDEGLKWFRAGQRSPTES